MARRSRYVLVAIGTDRPGIVAGVSKVLYEHGGNLEDSRMARLGDQFVMLLMTSAAAGLPTLLRAFRNVERRMGLKVFLQPQRSVIRKAIASPQSLYLISVYGADHPGIVYRVTRWLANQGVNITDMTTRLADSGRRPLYLMALEVQLPRGKNPQTLKAGLSRLSRALSVTLAMNPVEPVTL